MTDTFDFSGYVTKYDILCSDGRIIAKNAFNTCNNKIVSLTYNLNPSFVIGNVTLECRPDGVYGYCKLNDSASGKIFSTLIKDHIFENLGIYATDLITDKNKIVTHGIIREVAIVQHSANPETYIDYYADMKKEVEND